MNLLFSLFIATVLIACASKTLHAEGSQPNNPGQCFDLLQSQGYMAVYKCQLQRKNDFLVPPHDFIFDQYTATILSFLGENNEANQIFDKNLTEAQRDAILLNNYKSVSAVEELIRRVKGRQIVLINEAHHVPQTRQLTLKLLKPLYDQGFRYFAAETFNEDFVSEMNQSGVPKLTSGFYVADPVFGQIIREAKKIGFEFVAYEHAPKCDPFNSSPDKCQNLREKGQAENLFNRIFKKNPKAKVFVHAGYGHIDKVGGSESFPWVPMAKYLWDLTGIEPFSIDQTLFRERGYLKAEHPHYRNIVDDKKIREPSILISKNNSELYVDHKYRGHYDMQIILPPEELQDGRPSWRSDLKGFKLVKVRDVKCPLQKVCLLQAFQKSELELGDSIPIDQVLLKVDHTPHLVLRPGEYFLKLFDQDSNLLSIKSFHVHGGL